MKDYLLFKKLHTSKLLPSMYWLGVLFFCAISYSLYTDWVEYQVSHYGGGFKEDSEFAYKMENENIYCKRRYVTPKEALEKGCIDEEEYEDYMSEANEEKNRRKTEEAENQQREEKYKQSRAEELRLTILIAFVIIQLFWRIYCEWWKRLFTFFNRKREAKDNSNQSLIKGIISLDKEITIPFYIVFYLLGALGSLIGIIVFFMEMMDELSFSLSIAMVLFLLFFQLFWRLIFEFYVVVFNFLKR